MFVYPCIRGSGGFNSLGKSETSIYINHGITMLSAVMKKHGHKTSLIDLRECTSWQDVYYKMKSSKADLFAVHMPTLDFHEAQKIALWAYFLKVPSVVGGPHPSICPEHVQNKTAFDFIVAGEGEIVLPDIATIVEGKCLEKTFCSEESPRIIQGEHPNLDELPMEDREIFNMEKVLSTKHPFYPTPFISVISGRGCPFRCSFCHPAESMIFGKFRMRNVENLMDEIRYLSARYNYKMLMVDDDSFTLNPNYVDEFCELYEKIRRPFTCQTRADFVVKHPDLVKKMRKAGCWMFVMGLEHGSQRMLDFMNKGTTVAQNYEAVNIAHNNGIKVWANVMFGLPTETREETLETVKMLTITKPYHISPSFFTPIPGTELFDYCKQNDLLFSDDPAHLGTRSLTGPKIKGVDYPWLFNQVAQLHSENIMWLPTIQKMKRIVRWGLQRMGIKR